MEELKEIKQLLKRIVEQGKKTLHEAWLGEGAVLERHYFEGIEVQDKELNEVLAQLVEIYLRPCRGTVEIEKVIVTEHWTAIVYSILDRKSCIWLEDVIDYSVELVKRKGQVQAAAKERLKALAEKLQNVLSSLPP